MHPYFLTGLLGYMLAFAVFAKEPMSSSSTVLTYRVMGRVLDYEWAHRQNLLAVLVENPPQPDKLIVLEAKSNSQPLIHTFSRARHPNCLAWLKFDSGFLLAISANTSDENASIDELYRYTFNEPREQLIYANIERQFANVVELLIDADSDYWALASGGEGVSDVSIYQNERLILSTEVFPGSISAVLWQDKRLLVLSDAYLEYGLTTKEREHHPHFNSRAIPAREWGDISPYFINPDTRTASPDNTVSAKKLERLTHTSFDGAYLSEISNENNEVMIKIRTQ